MTKQGGMVALTLLLIVLGIGGKLLMNQQKEAAIMREEMLKVVKSEEAKKVIEEGLKNLDAKALTSEGGIQSYKIDYKSIEHNPMGGIDVTVVINEDSSMDIAFNITKKEKTLVIDGADLSGNLSKQLKKKEYE